MYVDARKLKRNDGGYKISPRMNQSCIYDKENQENQENIVVSRSELKQAKKQIKELQQICQKVEIFYYFIWVKVQEQRNFYKQEVMKKDEEIDQLARNSSQDIQYLNQVCSNQQHNLQYQDQIIQQLQYHIQKQKETLQQFEYQSIQKDQLIQDMQSQYTQKIKSLQFENFSLHDELNQSQDSLMKLNDSLDKVQMRQSDKQKIVQEQVKLLRLSEALLVEAEKLQDVNKYSPSDEIKKIQNSNWLQ